MMTNNEAIRVSVICVTYNHEKYIREALDSIISQKTDFSFEVLVGEDCSTDSTREILREYEKTLLLYCSFHSFLCLHHVSPNREMVIAI